MKIYLNSQIIIYWKSYEKIPSEIKEELKTKLKISDSKNWIFENKNKGKDIFWIKEIFIRI